MNFERRKKLAGRKKEPLELIQAKGKKHLTKEEIKNRMLTQIVAPSDNIIPPDGMKEELKEAFKEARAAAADLGLTIASRCKLVAPKAKEEKPKNKFERFAK